MNTQHDVRTHPRPNPRRRRRGLVRGGAVAAAAALLVTGAAVSPPTTGVQATTTLTSTITDLGTLGGNAASAEAVDEGLIVGGARTAGGRTHAYALDTRRPGSSMVDLGTVGGSWSKAVAVSGDLVAGTSASTSSSTEHAFAYDLGDAVPTMIDLGTLGGPYSEATAVDGEVVVGTATRPAGATRAFAYDLAAEVPRMRGLGSLGGASFATDVSGDLVVGYSFLGSAVTGASAHAFVFDLDAPAPTMVDLGTLGGGYSKALAVDGDLVVGVATRPNGRRRAFVVDMSASTPTMRGLGTLGGGWSEARAISGTTVVGASGTGAGVGHAFAYDLSAPEPTMRDLGSLGGDSEAIAVDGDTVVGGATTLEGTHGWAYDLASAAPEMSDLGPVGGRSWVSAVDGDLVVGSSDGVPSRAVSWRIFETTAPALEFRAFASEIREDGGQATVTVVRGGQAEHAVEVSYSARGGDADGREGPGQDFVRTSGVLSFGVGETEKSFTVTVLDDTRQEPDEDITLRLGSPTNGAVLGTPRIAALRIRASDQQPDVMVGPRRMDLIPCWRGMVRVCQTSYAGFDVYNSTALGQTLTFPGRRTQTRAIYFRVETGGNAVGAFRIKGSAAPPNTRLRYFLGGKDVTAALRSPEGRTVVLAPYPRDGIAAVKVVTAKVTILRGAAIGSRKPVAVRSIYKGDAPVVDKARGVVKVVR